ncbi:MAG: ABC transporter substrate-binding protein [Caldilineaceae bacterium]
MELIGLLVLALLSACATVSQPATDATADDAVTTSTDSAESAARGTLRVPHSPLVMNGSETLDPASPVNFEYAIIMLYDRLVSLGEGGQIAPSLATTWEANDDATTWTFTLREGVTFHDGQPLTSADVAYSFRHILDPAVEAPAAATLGLIETIETPDEGTVVFQLGQPHADFPSLLVEYTAHIIPDGSGDTIATTGIGTGPFKLVTLNVEGTTILTANDQYWNGAPQLASIELIAIPDAEARSTALQAGQIDIILNTTATQAALFVGNPDYTVLSFPTGQWGTLAMRTDTPPFDDIRVRKAMRLVVDRQAMIDLVLDGQGTVSCDNPVSTTDAYYWATECPQDLEQAKALLAEAGYAEGLDVTLHASDTETSFIPLAEVYQQQAAAAGINVKLLLDEQKQWAGLFPRKHEQGA